MTFRDWFRRKTITKINTFFAFYALRKLLTKARNDSELFFFFPFYHVGGAERVHIDILQSVADKKPWIFFTSESANDAFLSEFKKYGTPVFLNLFTKKFYHQRVLNLISSYINKHENAVLFSSNCHFFYKMVPKIRKGIKCMDLIHAFNHKHETGAEHWSLPVVAQLSRRVFISHKAIDDLRMLYLENNISENFLNRVIYIPNKVSLPKELKKNFDLPLNAVYVGRMSHEKRLHILVEVAKLCNEKNLQVKFIFVGDNKSAAAEGSHSYIQCTGEITDIKLLQKIYEESHITLISSSREGFPLAIMEGMAYGSVPVCTAVGDIPFHIKNGSNGLLIHEHDEAAIITSFVEKISALIHDKALLKQLSENAYGYALKNFGEEKFMASYRDILRPD